MTSIPSTIAETFTRDAALAVETAADAKRYVAKAAKFSQDSGEREAFVGVAAAYATHAAVRTGYLGGSDGIAQDEYAALYGRSKSAVTLWKRLGVAFVDKGIDPSSDLGSVLRTGANKSAIAKVIMDADSTEADIRKAAEAVYVAASDGSLTTKAKPVQREGAQSTAGEALSVPRNDTVRLDMMEACLAALSSELEPGIAKRLGEFADAVTEALAARKVQTSKSA